MKGYRFAENLERGDIIRDLGDGQDVFLFVYDVRVLSHRPGVQILTDSRSLRGDASKVRIVEIPGDVVEVQEQDRARLEDV